jgi:hypothetical protein
MQVLADDREPGEKPIPEHRQDHMFAEQHDDAADREDHEADCSGPMNDALPVIEALDQATGLGLVQPHWPLPTVKCEQQHRHCNE